MSIAKIAIITGASSGIGEELSRYLLSQNYKVIGLGRDFSKSTISHKNFIQSIIDLSDVSQVEDQILLICKANTINLFVHCAGVGYYGAHDSISSQDLIEMVNVNFTSAAIMSRCIIPFLRETKGQMIFVSSVSSLTPSRLGACYGATKAAINHLAASLFEEVRKSEVKVSNLIIDMTRTKFHDKCWFGPSEDEGAALEVSDISKALDFILSNCETAVINEIVIRPQFHRISKK